jgi:hypothetical protein
MFAVTVEAVSDLQRLQNGLTAFGILCAIALIIFGLCKLFQGAVWLCTNKEISRLDNLKDGVDCNRRCCDSRHSTVQDLMKRVEQLERKDNARNSGKEA